MVLPPSLHQHCIDEAQKAETVLSAVSYIYICAYFFASEGLILFKQLTIQLMYNVSVSYRN